MGLLDIRQTVLTEYRADTKQMKAALKDLSGEEKKLAEQRLADAERQNKSIEESNKRWATAGKVIGAVGAAAGIAYVSLKAHAQESRLAAAAAGADIDRLAKASGGLQTRMQLLEFAAKAQHGAFKLNNEQMETAQKAIRALTQAGYDQAEVTQKVTDAIVKLEGDGLKDFGIRVRESKTDTEKFTAVMDALAGSAGAVDESGNAAGESIARAGVKFEDAFDSIKVSIGSMVAEMGPLIEAAAELAGVAAKLTNKIAQGWSHLGAMGATALGDRDALKKYNLTWDEQAGDYYLNSGLDQYRRHGGTTLGYAFGQASGNLGRQGAGELLGGFQQLGADLLGMGRGALGAAGNVRFSSRRGGSKGAAAPDPFAGYSDFQGFGEIAGTGLDDRLSQGKADFAAFTAAAAAAGDAMREKAAGIDRINLAFADAQQALLEYEAKQQQTFLEGTFGKLEDFNLYANAFQTLTGAVGSSLEAWITGSKGAGDAFKEFLADAVKGLAVQMGIEALKHGAYAIGSAAFGNFAGAATHAKAALAFAGGSALAAVAARELGQSTGQWAGPAGGGAAAAAPSVRGSSAGSGSSEPTRIIVYADAFAEDSERGRREQAKKIVKRAMGSGPVEN